MTKHPPKAADDQLFPQHQVITQASELVQERLLHAPPVISEITTHLAGSTGKGIRTVLLTAAAADAGGMVPHSAAKAAAAIELLHMATLVHDDVIDDALTRRGQPSVQSRFGKKRAVIGGDWLLCCAMNAATSVSIREERHASLARLLPQFTRAVERICLGELTQGSHNGDVDLKAGQYLRVIAQKTAALFYLSAYFGAVLGEKSEEQTKLLLRFSTDLGIVFQIVDDLKDYVFEETDALKTVKNDLLSGVVTMPLIIAFQREPEMKGIAKEAMRTGAGINELVRQVAACGGIDETRRIARRYADRARSLLDRLDNGYQREQLTALLDRAVEASKTF